MVAYGSSEPAGETMAVEATAVAVELPSLQTRKSWFDDWDEKTRDERDLARRDRDYFDNHQWTEEELRVLRHRKQPALVKNYIAPKVNTVRGEEIRKRIDP